MNIVQRQVKARAEHQAPYKPERCGINAHQTSHQQPFVVEGGKRVCLLTCDTLTLRQILHIKRATVIDNSAQRSLMQSPHDEDKIGFGEFTRLIPSRDSRYQRIRWNRSFRMKAIAFSKDAAAHKDAGNLRFAIYLVHFFPRFSFYLA